MNTFSSSPRDDRRRAHGIDGLPQVRARVRFRPSREQRLRSDDGIEVAVGMPGAPLRTVIGDVTVSRRADEQEVEVIMTRTDFEAVKRRRVETPEGLAWIETAEQAHRTYLARLAAGASEGRLNIEQALAMLTPTRFREFPAGSRRAMAATASSPAAEFRRLAGRDIRSLLEVAEIEEVAPRMLEEDRQAADMIGVLRQNSGSELVRELATQLAAAIRDASPSGKGGK